MNLSFQHTHENTLLIFNVQVKLQGAENNFGAAVVNKVRHDVANEQPTAGTEAYEDAGASSAQVDVKSDQGLAIEDMLLTALVPFLKQTQIF